MRADTLWQQFLLVGKFVNFNYYHCRLLPANHQNSCFVKCMKMMYNGKVQLYYLTKGLKSFSSMISSMDSENFLTIVANILSDIIDVKHNGFLSCQNIDIAFEHIFPLMSWLLI